MIPERYFWLHWNFKQQVEVRNSMSTSDSYAVLCGLMQFRLLYISYMITIKTGCYIFSHVAINAIKYKTSQIFKEKHNKVLL